MRATSRSTFDIRNLKRDRISLYLDVRREQITSLGPLFNVLITQMMNFMSETMPRPEERYTLWQKTFPAQITVADDIDWRHIAARHELTGPNTAKILKVPAF